MDRVAHEAGVVDVALHLLEMAVPYLAPVVACLTLVINLLLREDYKTRNRRQLGVRNMRHAHTPAEWLSVSVATLPRRKYRLVLYGRYVGVRKLSRVHSVAERELLERKFGFYGVALVPKVRPTLVIREREV